MMVFVAGLPNGFVTFWPFEFKRGYRPYLSKGATAIFAQLTKVAMPLPLLTARRMRTLKSTIIVPPCFALPNATAIGAPTTRLSMS